MGTNTLSRNIGKVLPLYADVPEKRRSHKHVILVLLFVKCVEGRAQETSVLFCFASETTKNKSIKHLLKFHDGSEGEMLSCPVQVTKVDAGVEIQFHVFLALDLQGSGQPYDSDTAAPVASDQEAWRQCRGQKPGWMLWWSKTFVPGWNGTTTHRLSTLHPSHYTDRATPFQRERRRGMEAGGGLLRGQNVNLDKRSVRRAAASVGRSVVMVKTRPTTRTQESAHSHVQQQLLMHILLCTKTKNRRVRPVTMHERSTLSKETARRHGVVGGHFSTDNTFRLFSASHRPNERQTEQGTNSTPMNTWGGTQYWCISHRKVTVE